MFPLAFPGYRDLFRDMLPMLSNQFRIGLTCADILLTFFSALRVLSVRVLISATSDPTRGELDGSLLLALA